jgi:hypothetical protein
LAYDHHVHDLQARLDGSVGVAVDGSDVGHISPIGGGLYRERIEGEYDWAVQNQNLCGKKRYSTDCAEAGCIWRYPPSRNDPCACVGGSASLVTYPTSVTEKPWDTMNHIAY